MARHKQQKYHSKPGGDCLYVSSDLTAAAHDDISFAMAECVRLICGINGLARLVILIW